MPDNLSFSKIFNNLDIFQRIALSMPCQTLFNYNRQYYNLPSFQLSYKFNFVVNLSLKYSCGMTGKKLTKKHIQQHEPYLIHFIGPDKVKSLKYFYKTLQ